MLIGFLFRIVLASLRGGTTKQSVLQYLEEIEFWDTDCFVPRNDVLLPARRTIHPQIIRIQLR